MTKTYEPGTRVRITQQVPRLSGSLATTFEGTVIATRQRKSGSWFAHSRDHKVWIDCIDIEKDDGELVTCNLDQWTHLEVID